MQWKVVEISSFAVELMLIRPSVSSDRFPEALNFVGKGLIPVSSSGWPWSHLRQGHSHCPCLTKSFILFYFIYLLPLFKNINNALNFKHFIKVTQVHLYIGESTQKQENDNLKNRAKQNIYRIVSSRMCLKVALPRSLPGDLWWHHRDEKTDSVVLCWENLGTIEVFSGESSGWGLHGQNTAVADSPFIGTTTGTIRTQSGHLVRHKGTFVVRLVNQTNFQSDSSHLSGLFWLVFWLRGGHVAIVIVTIQICSRCLKTMCLLRRCGYFWGEYWTSGMLGRRILLMVSMANQVDLFVIN